MRKALRSQENLVLLEKLDSNISGEDSIFVIFEDFRVDNVNVQNASSTESSDSDAVEHFVNVISTVIPKSRCSCGHGQPQGHRNNVSNLSDYCSNGTYSLSKGIIWTLMNLSCPPSIAGRTLTRKIVKIPSGPSYFTYHNIGINSSSA